jgi:predicted nucleic acid-binding protein
VIIPDINLLVYAHNEQAPQHAMAREWWENLLNGVVLVEHRAELHSCDSDFSRFPGLHWVNPLCS